MLLRSTIAISPLSLGIVTESPERQAHSENCKCHIYMVHLYRGYSRGGCRSLQTTFFLWFLESKACRLPKNGAEACIPTCIFLYPKPADLIFEMPKPADQIFFRGKARFLNKYLKAPIKHIILFTSHIFPQQTNYIFNPSFIDPYLKVEQSLHFYGENCKACRLLF